MTATANVKLPRLWYWWLRTNVLSECGKTQTKPEVSDTGGHVKYSWLRQIAWHGIWAYSTCLRGAPAEEPTVVLRPEALALLPEDLRAELADALLWLDVPRVRAVVERVGEEDAALGAVLKQYTQRLAFSAIRKALEASENTTRENVP